ncbi:aconitase/3-isopropylmalate dehydratase large subunit family protein [Rhizobium pusense]|uniref:3-isopropylmalate dehydratase large subunit n=5 Tax=Hyphomicrobiales TaxID=356 RepID=A0A256GDB1_9HYPH|nr:MULTISPECIES: aconitase/3-isopropylmalate dehydratase large subunit family protein [Hyphomicrobiales]QCM13554.1 3-isopropylmalate dehydratase large subunit [Agrobacterium tumefaciens]KAB2702040.1 3-isopropylmalate dehydratase large subunit [Brucella lupini]MCD4659598.1 3-isopropylmalate dehydratase large subunit [Agrobacterium sp.]MDH0912981.1 aconitase/3-isopropylmalate dehydratase large subunit family protein [Agrobacterium pusense]MDH1099248.1 aconitase/3-isopropylmalate dehydratase larg
MNSPTLVEQIIAGHAKRDFVSPGELVTASVDRVYLQDGNSPTIAGLFAEHGFSEVFDRERIGIFFDHSVIAPDKHIAARLREAERLAERLGVRVFRAGEGISHVVALEEGWYEPGTIVVGSDSHTCTGGATQCLALGMGASDCTAAMVTGETWLRVPETVWINVLGRPGSAARARDVALFALAENTQLPFLYKAVEWTGEWFSELGLDSCASVANLGVEMGAKCTFLPPGVGRPSNMQPINLPAADDPRVISLNIDGLPPMISKPHSPGNAVPISECEGLQINYVFIGTCTNGRLEDIAEAAEVLGGAKVRAGVQCLVTPGSQRVYLEAMELGYITKLVRAGAIISPPGCSACLGTQGSIPASGDRVLSTMNRNFLGRMGNPEAEIYLASPLVAAHTAIRGELPKLSELTS